MEPTNSNKNGVAGGDKRKNRRQNLSKYFNREICSTQKMMDSILGCSAAIDRIIGRSSLNVLKDYLNEQRLIQESFTSSAMGIHDNITKWQMVTSDSSEMPRMCYY
jgi:hypothetical protein